MSDDEKKNGQSKPPNGLTVGRMTGGTMRNFTFVGVNADIRKFEGGTLEGFRFAGTAEEAAAFEQTKEALAEELTGVVLDTDRKMNTDLLIQILLRLSQPDVPECASRTTCRGVGIAGFPRRLS